MREKREYFFKSLAVTQVFSVILFAVSFAFIISNAGVVGAQAQTPISAGGNNFIYGAAKGAALDGKEIKSVWRIGDEWRAQFSGGESAVIDEKQAGSFIEGELPKPKVPDGGGAAEESGGITGLIGDIYGGKLFPAAGGKVSFIGGLVSGLAWGGTVYLAVNFLAPAFGANEYLTKALSSALGAGVFAGRTSFLLFGKGGEFATSSGEILGLPAGQGAFVIGLAVAVVVFIALYKKEKKEVIQYQCLPWEAPLGGQNCEECNKDSFRPCSEYRCKSLGQACDLVNKGTEEEKCVWVARDDVTSPTITPWDDALSEGHKYTNHDTRPPSLGVKITKEGALNGCLAAFTPLQFGVFLNEPGQCKIDYDHKEKFDEMQFFMGENNLFRYNHTQRMSLPSPDSFNSESPELENDGIYDLFVRCRDANGNENVDEFVFGFCVDPSPDTTPPVIVDTSIENGAPVAFGVGEIEVSAFVNEPAECKWSIDDKNYEDMENTFSCSTSVLEINAELVYECSTTLTGVKDNAENNYYFRCKDKPNSPENERNVNVQSYGFALRGTRELNIIDVGPNKTIKDSTEVVNVDLTLETSNGANEGQAICYFSDTGEEGDFVAMFESNSFEHKQTLSLVEGDYTYYFRCVDAGGNSDTTTTSFRVETDSQAPLVTRVYRDLDALKIVTDEDAQCMYSLNSCNYVFEEGIAMIYSNPNTKTNHYAQWSSSNIYHVKCRDEFGNEPSPNACSIVVSASVVG